MEQKDAPITRKAEAPAVKPALLRVFTDGRKATALWAYGLTVLVGAFLLFSIQPIAGKMLLPRLGGSTSVWSATLLFFMGVLLLGYVYAYILSRLRISAQIIVHAIVLLGVSLSVVINAIDGRLLLKETAYAAVGDAPFLYIFRFLAVQIGAPCLLLSATSTLLQVWFGTMPSGRTPYRLYASSNAGSLAAIAAYPFVIEPYLPLSWQMQTWSAVFMAYAVGMLLCMIYAFTTIKRTTHVLDSVSTSIRPGSRSMQGFARVLCWIGLPALASFQLVTTTAEITQGIAAVPFFWLVPLALYLLSYILCFSGERWYGRMPWTSALFGGIFFSIVIWTHMLISVSVLYELAIYSAILFCLCMVCHGELYRARPDSRFIAGFYMASALGGALGGFLGSVVSPMVFTRGLWEFPFGLLMGGILGGTLFVRSVRDLFSLKKRRILQYAVAAALVLPFIITVADKRPSQLIEATRNFYGVLNIRRAAETNSGKSVITLDNGRILHGNQFVESAYARTPTTYYGFESGAGLALRFNPQGAQGKPVRVGVIGLGTGTLAAYCREKDYFRFYELNPEVIKMARKHFSYLSSCRGSLDIIEGDARVALEEERRSGALHGFDVLLVDAFTDDAIPAHLLTREALALYADHLNAEHGLLGIHISNHYLNLAPLVGALARDAGWESILIDSPGEAVSGGVGSEWVLLTRDKAFFKTSPFRKYTSPFVDNETSLWTDEYSSIFEVLR